MTNTYQFQNQNILQHGISVHNHYKSIITAIDINDFRKYKIPDKLIKNWKVFKKKLYHIDVMKQYHIYHDCGKPLCRSVDENGRQHFPNHAEYSYNEYKKCFSDDIVASLIKDDMIFHSGSMGDIIEYITKFKSEGNHRFLFSLWLTSLAEIYSNREMFLNGPDGEKNFQKKYDKLVKVLDLIL